MDTSQNGESRAGERGSLFGCVNGCGGLDYIPGSRQNPKILWVDDAEVVGDRIAKALPVFGDFFA
jgi:hypothetical protein